MITAIKPFLFASVIMAAVALVCGSDAYAEDEWVSGNTVSLQALDKITARISTLTIPVATPMRYGGLQIIIHGCSYRPPTMAPEHAALMEIRTIDHHQNVAADYIFQGWMFASSPALNALEHPVYDVSVLACRND